MLFGLGGKKPKPSHVCGGTTDKTDHNAPKEIKSKDITDLSVTFYLSGEWSSFETKQRFSFDIKPDENGGLTLTELDKHLSAAADKDLLASVQQVIDETRLALKNGISKVTAGLPPPYQPCYVTINYASGEKISFTENNNPDAKWAKQMYLTFADWFASHGNDKFLPPVYKGTVDSVRLDMRKSGIYTSYSLITVLPEQAIGGERTLFGKRKYDHSLKKETLAEFILQPDDFYQKVGSIIDKYDMRPFDKCSVLYEAPSDKKGSDEEESDKLSLHIHHEDNHQINIDTSDPERIEKLRPLISDLIGYYDHLFDTAEMKTSK